ncbi:MAG: complex I NDUFA9 subunit family protein [Pelagibacterales bacterium]|nr:complex I NDUFA9 subunit family protein [Pelagibacterales bacterium]
MKIAVIFGGSGFIGQSLVKKLLNKGFRVKVVTRNPEQCAFLKTFAGVDFLSITQWNYKNKEKLDSIISGSHVVINLVGLLYENKKEDFKEFHTNLAQTISTKCNQLKIPNLIHISALAIQNSQNSKYAKSKLEAENSVLENFVNATILRPSIVFGKKDNFFNKFAQMSKTSPFLPLINGGKSKFQPIYVEDLTSIICNSVDNLKVKGKCYEIGGNKVYSFKELLELVLSYVGKERKFINISFCQASLIAVFLEIFTKKILTKDQVELLKTDNILSEDSFKKDFQINLKSIEEIVPTYIN